MFVPVSKVKVIVALPDLLELEATYNKPSIPLISSSITEVTVSSTVLAEAPGNVAFTVILGGAILGYADTGSWI
jgi:hypothetical protein